MRREMMQTTGLWAARCGAVFAVSYGLETTLCLISVRPYHTSMGINFFSGFMGGYIFSLSDIVPRKTRWLVAFSYGILFCLAALYDGIPQEVPQEIIMERQAKREKRKLQWKTDGSQGQLSPLEQKYQNRLKYKMEKLYEASQDFSEVPKGTYVGDGAYGHEFIFGYLKSFKDRQKTSFGFTPWADESTKRMMKEKEQRKQEEKRRKEEELKKKNKTGIIIP